jgi:hypothetical protein
MIHGRLKHGAGPLHLAGLLSTTPIFYPSFLRQQESVKLLGNLKSWIPAGAGMTGYGKGTAPCSCQALPPAKGDCPETWRRWISRAAA